MRHFWSFPACFLLVVAISLVCSAEKIIEPFKPNSPLTRVTQASSSCAFTYTPAGYVAATVTRQTGPAGLGAYYVPISQTYFIPDVNGISTVDEFWLGFDFKYDPATAGVAAGHIGLFNSSSDNSTPSSSLLNSIAIVPLDGSKFVLQVEATDAGGARALSQSILSATINTTDTYRCKLHIYRASDQTKADVSVYTVDPNNVVKPVSDDTGLPVVSTDTFWSGVNALGIRNNCGSISPSKSIFTVDNMYFSTEDGVVDADLTVPGWLVPDDPNDSPVGDIDILANFRPEPDWQAFAGPESGTYFRYDTNGFLFCGTRRKNVADSVAAYYAPLGSRFYMPFEDDILKFWTVDEFWFGFDYQYVSGATAATFAVGLFNTDSTNLSTGSRQNCIGLTFHSGTTVAMRVIGNTSWSTPYQVESTIGSYSYSAGTYRFAVRVYSSSNKTCMDVACYEFDADGLLNTTPVFNSTGNVIADGTLGVPQKFLEGMDAFGVRNTSGGPSSQTRFNLDNMYFSTVGEVTFDAPSWLVPDCKNAGDFDCDQAVNDADLEILVNTWLSTVDLTADIDNSGRVDLADFAMFASYWLE